MTDTTERKGIKLSLQASEALNRAIIDGLSANIAVLNEAGDIIAVNKHWLQFGVENEVGLAGGFNEGVNYLAVCRTSAAQNDQIAQQTFDGIKAVLQGKSKKFEMEYPCHAPHQQRWYIMRVTPLLGAQPGAIVAHEKITERKQLEAILHENEARFRLLTEKASDLICLQEADGRYLYLSPSCERLLGYKPEELVGQSQYELFHPEDIERIQTESHDRARRGKEIASITYRIRRKSGEYIWFETTTQPVLNEHGQVTRLISASRDVTERRQAEEELRATQEQLRHVTAASPAVIFALAVRENETLETVWVSDYIVKLLGYTPDEALVSNWWSTRIHPEDREQALTNQSTLFENDALTHEYRFQHKDGSYLWFHDELRLLRDETGRPVEVIGSWLDITQRKQAELALEEERASLARRVEERTAELRVANAELARAARLKDEFLANMSHELRTPLNAILGMSEVLQMETFGRLNDKQHDSLKYIEEGGRHLLELINDILDLSKIEAGRLELNLDTIPVEEVCQASLRFVQQQALKKQIELVFDFDDNVKTLEVDELRLKQILVNLLTNAVKFTPSGGQLGLEVTRAADESAVRFTVWDTGMGISKEDLQKLFQPFVQLDSSLAREQEGTGLGLALVYRLAELHGGSVKVESRVGQGSRFTVAIPWRSIGIFRGKTDLPKVETTAPTALSEASVGLPRPLILLAEDNKANLVLVQGLLQAHGYDVIVARNGYEAVDQAREAQPALILMDIQMPGMDGLEAIQRIRADRETTVAQVPIIALTALAMVGDEERCLRAGANAYLSKPASMRRLLELIGEYLEKKETRS